MKKILSSKLIRWMFFIPLSLLGYYAFIFSIGIINYLFFSTDNYLMEKYIVPLILNIIGVFVYFKIGSKTLPKHNNVIYSKFGLFMLFIIIAIISGTFIYLSYIGLEYFKVLINSVNLVISIILFASLLGDVDSLD